MVNKLAVLFLWETKAIFLLSGDQQGLLARIDLVNLFLA
tara:strand:+ start:832 stop:948 length:117 start_codon:yes stop_codon:yes gene_type:complete